MQLAFTGSDAGGMAAIAALLLGVGCLLVAARRSRRDGEATTR